MMIPVAAYILVHLVRSVNLHIRLPTSFLNWGIFIVRSLQEG